MTDRSTRARGGASGRSSGVAIAWAPRWRHTLCWRSPTDGRFAPRSIVPITRVVRTSVAAMPAVVVAVAAIPVMTRRPVAVSAIPVVGASIVAAVTAMVASMLGMVSTIRRTRRVPGITIWLAVVRRSPVLVVRPMPDSGAVRTIVPADVIVAPA